MQEPASEDTFHLAIGYISAHSHVAREWGELNLFAYAKVLPGGFIQISEYETNKEISLTHYKDLTPAIDSTRYFSLKLHSSEDSHVGVAFYTKEDVQKIMVLAALSEEKPKGELAPDEKPEMNNSIVVQINPSTESLEAPTDEFLIKWEEKWGADSEDGEVAQFLQKKFVSLAGSGEQRHLDNMIAALSEKGVKTIKDIGRMIMKDSLLELYPTIPISVITLLVDFYSAKMFNKSGQVYGSLHGELVMTETPKIWTNWKKMLADIFFFFEYLYEEGSGPTSQWPQFNRRKGVAYRHDINSRLAKNDRTNYNANIAIRDSSGVIRAEILETLAMDKNLGSANELMDRLRSSNFTESQGAFMKRNIFEEEMKQLKRKYDTGTLEQSLLKNEEEEEDSSEGEKEKQKIKREKPVVSRPTSAHAEKAEEENILVDSSRLERVYSQLKLTAEMAKQEVKELTNEVNQTTKKVSRHIRKPSETFLFNTLRLSSSGSAPVTVHHNPLLFDSNGTIRRKKGKKSPSDSLDSEEEEWEKAESKRLSTVKRQSATKSDPKGQTTPNLSSVVSGGRISVGMRVEDALQDGELIVRFFGMKDCDGTLNVAAKLTREIVEVGPFELKGNKNKVSSKNKTVDPDAKRMKAHHGFYNILLDIHKGCLIQHGRDLVEQIAFRAGKDTTKRVILTGHSMGAALAAMVAYQLISRYPIFKLRLYVVQFGSPRYARNDLCKWLDKELKNRIIQIVLEGDPTPKSPPVPPFFGWYTPGIRVELSAGTLFKANKDNRDHMGNATHFQYWEVLRTMLAYHQPGK